MVEPDDVMEVFDYNRKNYQWDSKMLIKREYQEQKMRVEQAALYRGSSTSGVVPGKFFSVY